MARLAVAAALLSWALLDQVRYVLALDRGSAPALEQAARLNPYDSAVRMRMANEASRAGNAREAVNHAQRAVELQPDLPTAHAQLARMLLAAGRGDEALVALNVIQSRWPGDANVLVNLGLLHRTRGDLEKAKASWLRALEIDDTQVRVHLYLAELLAVEGSNEVAIGGFERYLQLVVERGDPLAPDPGEAARVMVVCAELHDALGHRERADQWLAAAESTALALARQDIAERVQTIRRTRTAGSAGVASQ